MVLNRFLVVLFVLAMAISCRNEHSNFVAPAYQRVSPLAEIKNSPIISDESRSFHLDTAAWIQIYGTAETDIGMVSVDQVYWYKPDEVEVYMLNEKGEGVRLNFPLHDENGKSVEVFRMVEDVLCHAAYDSDDRLYRVQISIPFQKLPESVRRDKRMKLNVTVADNDDKLKQKAKLAWVGEKDPRYQSTVSYGELVLKEEIDPSLEDRNGAVLQSLYWPVASATMAKDTSFVAVSQLLFGLVNKAEDLSARMYSIWDNDYLHLHLIIFDNREGPIIQANSEKSVFLHDRGWIEDEAGNIVWQMTNYHTQHAGGAEKNRKVDTTVYMPKGNYILRYMTDESHSWDNWDDKAPDVPFYGIVLYRKKL